MPARYGKTMRIREERPGDIDAIHRLNAAAFDTDVEARLVDALREQGALSLSLVAEENGEILGHIAFSPMSTTPATECKLIGLAPMAVTPGRQNQGIGSALVREGIERCKQQGVDAVFVLGHPNYYPRFGFVPAVSYRLRSDYDVPNEVFMVRELTPGGLNGVEGIAHYHPVFAGV
jgi:putative acetyltransferase